MPYQYMYGIHVSVTKLSESRIRQWKQQHDICITSTPQKIMAGVGVVEATTRVDIVAFVPERTDGNIESLTLLYMVLHLVFRMG
jgi:hypothetical protein